MKTALIRLHNLVKLTSNAKSAAYIIILYGALSIRRWIGLEPAFKKSHKIFFSFNNISFPVYVQEQIDFDLIYEIFVLKEYFIPETDNIRIIFDIGSNIGMVTIFFCVMYPDAIVYAFEPIPKTAERFLNNTRFFKDRVRFQQKAILSSTQSEITMYINPNMHWSSSVMKRNGADQMVKVETTTLEQFMKVNNIKIIDILKFDIEGAEYDVFNNFDAENRVRFAIGEFHPDLAAISKQYNPAELFNGFRTEIKGKEGNDRFVAVFRPL